MPARKRHRRPPEHPDPVVRFARAVEATDEQRKERARRVQAEQREAARLRELAAERAAQIERARCELDAAIASAKAARASGRGVTEADEAWKLAKGRLIELETGEAPDWA